MSASVSQAWNFTRITFVNSCTLSDSVRRNRNVKPLNVMKLRLLHGSKRHIPSLSKGGEENATILYCDETGSSLKGATGTTWAEVGVTPTVYLPTSKWDRMSVIGGITRDGRVLSNSVVGSVKSAGVVAFLEYVLNTMSGQVIVVFDNARIHKSKLVQAFVTSHARLEIVHTPPYQRIHAFLYAPECNPVEWLWSWVKRTELVGLPARSAGDLRAAWRRGLARVRARVGLV